MEDQHLALVSHVKAPNRPRSEEDLNAELEKAKAMKDARDAASRAEELKAKKERQAELEKKIARANEAAEDTRNAPRLTMPDDNGSEMGFSDIFSTDVDLGSSMDEDMPTPYRLVEIQEDSGNPEFEDSRNKYYDL